MKMEQIKKLAEIRKHFKNQGNGSINEIECELRNFDYKINCFKYDSRGVEVVEYVVENSAKLEIPLLSNRFTFGDFGIVDNFNSNQINYKSLKRIGNKNAFIGTDSAGNRFLLSYNTIIGVVKAGENTIYLNPSAFDYSTTTTRHVSVFKREIGTNKMCFIGLK